MKKRGFALLGLLAIAIVVGFSWPEAERAVVVIDAGHGGKDPGTISVHGRYEKDINAQIAEQLKQAFLRENIQVEMTRSGDDFVSLEQRVQSTNAWQPDLMISIHANAVEQRPDVRGLQVLYYPDEAGKNMRFAEEAMQHLIAETGAADKGVIARPELAVLRGTNVQALLIETGFLSNPEEAELLATPAYQQQLVKGLVQAVLQQLEVLKQTETQ